MPGVFSSKRNFLFDLDGTLVDSIGAHTRAYVGALGANHSEMAKRFDYARFAGQPTRQVFGELGIVEPELAELTRRKQEIYRRALEKGEVRLFPGVDDLLVRLREGGCRLFIVTGASRISAERILERTKMGKWFEGMIAGEDATAGKPSAAPYLLALSKYDLKAAECLVVEDGESGILSARAAGLDAVLMHTNLKMDGVVHVRDCANFLTMVAE